MFELPQKNAHFAFPNDGHCLVEGRITCVASNGTDAGQWILDSKRTQFYLVNSIMPVIPGI